MTASTEIELPYKWKQTLAEVDLTVPLPEGTKSRDLSVQIRKDSIKVALKNRPDSPIIDGQLFADIKTNDSTWLLDAGELCIHLEKQNGMEWWRCVLKGDPEIDTSTLQPENSRLADLDLDTRGVVEKMMFDQRQKAMGLPDSDTMKKMDMLRKFQEQHPEMDFSQNVSVFVEPEDVKQQTKKLALDKKLKMDALTSGQSLSTQKDQIMNQVRAEMAMANAQELLTKINDKCFAKCITKPSSKLDGSDQTCLARCMDRYMDAWNIVSKAYHSKMSEQGSAMLSAGQGSDDMY